MSAELHHASCVTRFNRGVLIRGRSGAGKSSLALALIDRGWTLVADDQVLLSLEAGVVMARVPERLRGLLEVRAVGIIACPARLGAPVSLVVDLVSVPTERLPAAHDVPLLGMHLAGLMLAENCEKSPLRVVEALRHMGV